MTNGLRLNPAVRAPKPEHPANWMPPQRLAANRNGRWHATGSVAPAWQRLLRYNLPAYLAIYTNAVGRRSDYAQMRRFSFACTGT